MLRGIAFGLLTLALAAALFLSFAPDVAGAILLLMLLILGQISLFFKRIRRKGAPAIEVNSEKLAGLAKALEAAKKKKQAAGPSKPLNPQAEKLEVGLHPSIFSQFRKNLAASEAPRQPLTRIDEDVIVSVNKAKAPKPKFVGRNPYVAGQPKPDAAATAQPAQPEPALLAAAPPAVPPAMQRRAAPATPLLSAIPTEPLGELFSDLDAEEEANLATGLVQPTPRKRPEEIRLEAVEENADDAEAPAAPPKNPLLAEIDLDAPPAMPDQGDQLLAKARHAFNEADWDRCLEHLDAYLSREGGKDRRTVGLMRELKIDCLFAKGDYPHHLAYVQERLSKMKRSSSGFLKLMEKCMDQYITIDRQDLALPFLLTAMKSYNEIGDQKRLDVTYYHLAAAYRITNQPDSLLTTLQNHLSIKEQLNERDGQLPLLDQLGKLLYDKGDQAGSRRCYEQAVAIRQQLGQP